MDMYDQQNGYPDDANAAEGAELPQNPNQRRAVGAAAVGTAALGALGYGLSRLDDTDGDTDELTGDGTDNGDGQDANANESSDALAQLTPVYDPNANGTGGSELVTPVDHRSLDDMTFEEAFAASRQAMGPGHTFTWHGGLYNTFITEELDAMSNADRMAFVESLDLDEGSRGSGNEKPHMAAHHDRPQHHTTHQAPQMAHVQHDNTPEVHPIPVTTVLVGSTEVVPLMDATVNHDSDLLMADHSDNHMGPEITSVDDHHYEHGDSDAHDVDSNHSMSDDENVHFTH